jgi:hypothetical protein
VQHKYSIALMVYVVISLCEGFYLYCPLPVMMVSCFLTGILGVTSYTIRCRHRLQDLYSLSFRPTY